MTSLTLTQLKNKIIDFYWGDTVTPTDKTRPMFILILKDNYQTASTYIFSVQGSPPKGRAIYIRDYNNFGGDNYLILIRSNGEIAKSIRVDVTFDDSKEANARFIYFDKDLIPIEEEIKNGMQEEEIDELLDGVTIQ